MSIIITDKWSADKPKNGLFITIDEHQTNPTAVFSWVGNPHLIAHFLIEAIMSQNDLAMALLNNLANDPEVIRETLFNSNSKN